MLIVLAGLFCEGCNIFHRTSVANGMNRVRAAQTLDSLFKYYSCPNSALLFENFPNRIQDYRPSYLAGEDAEKNASAPVQYAYLWPYSGTFSAVCALLSAERKEEWKTLLEDRVLKGLDEYFDDSRSPSAYSSYLKSGKPSDRFYDDNIWLGIDFVDLYALTADERYLQRAQLLWRFIESGMDEKLGGGIYWCEQKKESKNTCSNAPASVFALKLYRATRREEYLSQGRNLYEWTKNCLQDTVDGLYYDNISLTGKVEKHKYAYNSGQMMQAAALLYGITREEHFLNDSRRLADACHRYFFRDFSAADGTRFHLLKKGDVWFHAVMMRGFAELYLIDGNGKYLDSFRKSLDYAWEHARTPNGLFHTDFSGNTKDERNWLLTQAAVVEMYARLAMMNDIR